ncbi:hypothetical protein [Mesorhizobium erdmanii]|uniref:Uncharacterized protein n=1 Tax=Mesorhizobium erdmanii TaxID=1777866 RepID=A0A6M7UK99_9HYPH|nr:MULTISPECIES: hypothetical protein [Mesorhizobium]OBQ71028.1 hypothetical protein A8146_26590 [Mesorhizobium loti]QKC76548.1 hypothetical protein EB233_14275 [Mesorhizobium erdmanii]
MNHLIIDPAQRVVLKRLYKAALQRLPTGAATAVLGRISCDLGAKNRRGDRPFGRVAIMQAG